MVVRPALVLFARAPVPGEVKTRLIPALGAEAAAELYRCFLQDALVQAAGLEAEVVVAVAEAGQAARVAELVAAHCPSAELLVQVGADLGERMLNAFRQVLRAGARAAVLVGTDVPHLPRSRVVEALSRAAEHEVVLGPARDGGYYLIGLHAVIPHLFQGLEWGTREVLGETLRRAQELGLTVTQLEPWGDVDTPADLAALRAYLAAQACSGQNISCPCTWQYLSTHSEVG